MREIRARAAAVLEEPRFTHPEVHDPALVHEVVGHRLDEAGMGLRMLVGGFRLHQLAGLVVDIVVPLARPVDAVSPVQPGVEPLRGVRRGALGRQHVPHLVIIRAGIVFGGEVAAFPAPVGPGARKTIENLLGGRLTDGFGAGVRFRTPQEFRNPVFRNATQLRRHAGLAEVFLCNDVAGHLGPGLRHFHLIEPKDDLTVGIADFGYCRHEIDPGVGVLPCRGEFAFDLHGCLAPFLVASRARHKVRCRNAAAAAQFIPRSGRSPPCAAGGSASYSVV